MGECPSVPVLSKVLGIPSVAAGVALYYVRHNTTSFRNVVQG